MRLPETDSSLLPVHQSADPKQSSTASQTLRAYITPTSAHSLPTYAGAHIYAAQTPHATETVKNTSAPSSRGKILLRCRNSRSPSRDASPIRPPPDKPGPHRDCLLCLLLRWAGLVQGSSTTSRGWL